MHQLMDAIDAACRLAHEGVWVSKHGEVEGQRLIIVVAVGQGAENLQRVLDAGASRDPRSTHQGD